MLKFKFEDTVASPPGPFGWCPIYEIMLGSKCLLFIQLRIVFAPQIASTLLNRIGPCAVIVMALSFFDFHFFHLGHPLAGDIPSMFLCIVDARPEG